MTPPASSLDVLPAPHSHRDMLPIGSGARAVVERAILEIEALRPTTTEAQARGTTLIEENRRLRAELMAVTP